MWKLASACAPARRGGDWYILPRRAMDLIKQPLMLVLFTASLLAQTPTSQLTGRITDSSEAVVPGASIVVISIDTNLERRAESNAAGYYTVSLLPPGAYRVSVRRDGFKPVARTGLLLAVDQVARLDFTLEVGSVTETIEVSAAGATVEAGTSALGTVVSSKQLLDIPLNSRNPLRLAYLVPGFVPTSSFSDQFNRASSFRINGGRSNMNDLFLDGISNSPPASRSPRTRPALSSRNTKTPAKSSKVAIASSAIPSVVVRPVVPAGSSCEDMDELPSESASAPPAPCKRPSTISATPALVRMEGRRGGAAIGVGITNGNPSIGGCGGGTSGTVNAPSFGCWRR